jgi:hypothetical protein
MTESMEVYSSENYSYKEVLSDSAFQISTGFLRVLGVLYKVKKNASFEEHVHSSFCDLASAAKPCVEFS